MCTSICVSCFFFFQAEDGIRYSSVTGVQTCALPICFVGRDLDILYIERYLLLKRNILLVRGMGGAGKTTLLHHLGFWWQTTGFVKEVFYFGYDERPWTRQQILHRIAHQILHPVPHPTEFHPPALP